MTLHVLYDLFEACLAESHVGCEYERGERPWIVRCGCACHECAALAAADAGTVATPVLTPIAEERIARVLEGVTPPDEDDA